MRITHHVNDPTARFALRAIVTDVERSEREIRGSPTRSREPSSWRWARGSARTPRGDTGEAQGSCVVSSCDDVLSDTHAGTDESQGAVFMPADLVLGRRTPTGMTQMQKR